MTGPAQAQPLCHKASDVAVMLGCSEWWIKEQARRGRIPYAFIGGAYRFTNEHVTQIVALFEVRPTEPAIPAAVVRLTPRTASPVPTADAPVMLRPRLPRRMRNLGMPESTAA